MENQKSAESTGSSSEVSKKANTKTEKPTKNNITNIRKTWNTVCEAMAETIHTVLQNDSEY